MADGNITVTTQATALLASQTRCFIYSNELKLFHLTKSQDNNNSKFEFLMMQENEHVTTNGWILFLLF